MFGFFKKAPKLEMAFTPKPAIARELAKEVEVAGELVLKNVGKDAELTALEVVLVAGGTRRIDLALPTGGAVTTRLPGGGGAARSGGWEGEARAALAGARRRDPTQHQRRRQARAAR